MQITKSTRSGFAVEDLPIPLLMEELAALGDLPPESRGKVIATLSFPVRVIKRDHRRETEPLYGRTHDAIAGIVGCRRPALLLCAGFSVLNRKNLNPVIKATQRVGTMVVLEKYEPPTSFERPPSFLVRNGVVTCMGVQYFSQGENATRASLDQLEADLDNRSFTILGRKCLLLICGEISVVCSNRAKRRVSFRRNVSDNLRQRLLSSGMIINPTHTLMRRHEIQEWRKFLSGDGRMYVSASNWERSKNRPTCRTLHSLWHDGNRQDYNRPAIENEWLCYREWTLP